MQIPFEIDEIPELEFHQIESFNDAREEIMRKIAETILRNAREKAEKAGAKNVSTAIGTGDPASSILGFAKRSNMDMIAMGTRGLSKLKGTHDRDGNPGLKQVEGHDFRQCLAQSCRQCRDQLPDRQIIWRQVSNHGSFLRCLYLPRPRVAPPFEVYRYE
jgi:hypothetical protein